MSRFANLNWNIGHAMGADSEDGETRKEMIRQRDALRRRIDVLVAEIADQATHGGLPRNSGCANGKRK